MTATPIYLKMLDERIDELSVRLLIVKEKISSLVGESAALERELGSLIEAKKGIVKARGVDSSAETVDTNQDAAKVNGVRRIGKPSRQGVQSGSIKEAALEVLKDNPEGLLAIDILKQINERRDEPIVRTSLSPQLSRLSRAGLVVQLGARWQITSDGLAAIPLRSRLQS